MQTAPWIPQQRKRLIVRIARVDAHGTLQCPLQRAYHYPCAKSVRFSNASFMSERDLVVVLSTEVAGCRGNTAQSHLGLGPPGAVLQRILRIHSAQEPEWHGQRADRPERQLLIETPH